MSGMDTTSRVSALGKALKSILDPTTDRLLPGYVELIQLVKSTTVAAREDRKEEERRYYEAQIARFNRDRRSHIKKDDKIRDFLMQKKADIYEIIDASVSKLKVFKEKSLIKNNMTAEEKVAQIQESLKNPQLKLLSKFVSHKKTETFTASNLSGISRQKMKAEQKRFKSLDNNG